MTWLQPLLDWVIANPDWAFAIIFAGVLLDSLFVIGVFLPGAVFMFGVGALIALGALEFWNTLALAAIAAVAGDSLTYAIGRLFRDRLFRWRLLAARPQLITHGQQFFVRHGGKSVILGRFIGPLRPVMPAVAAIYDMRLPLFLLYDGIACVGWALLFIVPGMAFGASLALAAEVATRLAVLLVSVLLLLFLLAWGVRVAVNSLQRHAEGWVHALLDWSHRHRRVGRLGEWLADPEQPETPALVIFALLVLMLSALWLWLWWGLGAMHPSPIDAVAWQTLRDLHTPLGIAMAVSLAALGEWPVYVPVAVAVLGVLLAQRRLRAAGHWVAAIGLAAVIALGLTVLLALPDPLGYFRGGAVERFSGRELVLATVVYGFIPVLLATRQSARVRTLVYGVSVSLIALIALAQMYVGAQWFTVGVFAIVIGAAWVLVLAIGYRRHGAQPLRQRGFLVVALGVFAVAAAADWATGFQRRVEALTPATQQQQLPAATWWGNGWRRLPTHRIDTAGLAKQPLNVQWLGPLDRIEAALLAAGWERTVPITWMTSLRWLARSPIAELPVLPQVHAGRAQALMLRIGLDQERQWLIRLWPTEWSAGRLPLWIGTVSQQNTSGLLRLLQFPATGPDFGEPLATLYPPPAPFEGRIARVPATDTPDGRGGAVLLIRPPA